MRNNSVLSVATVEKHPVSGLPVPCSNINIPFEGKAKPARRISTALLGWSVLMFFFRL